MGFICGGCGKDSFFCRCMGTQVNDTKQPLREAGGEVERLVLLAGNVAPPPVIQLDGEQGGFLLAEANAEIERLKSIVDSVEVTAIKKDKIKDQKRINELQKELAEEVASKEFYEEKAEEFAKDSMSACSEVERLHLELAETRKALEAYHQISAHRLKKWDEAKNEIDRLRTCPICEEESDGLEACAACYNLQIAEVGRLKIKGEHSETG